MRSARLTMIGGIAGLASLILLAWLFVLSPRLGEAGNIRHEAQTLRAQSQQLRAVISELHQKRANLPAQREYAQALAARMPADPDLTGLFTAVRAAAARAGIPDKNVTSIVPSVPVPAADPEPKADGLARAPKPVPGTVATMSLDLTVTGGADQMVRFLAELEAMDRAYLIDRVNIASDAGDAATFTMKVHGTLFVAPAPVDPDQPAD